MDQKDVAAISIAKSFNKKWWDGKRAFAARGSGTGEALDAWQKTCPNDVAKLELQAVEAAEKTCEKLRKALQVAIGKCGKRDQDTADGAKKMLKLIDGYEELLAHRKKDLVNKSFAIADDLAKIMAIADGYVTDLGKSEQSIKLVMSRIANYARESEGGLVEKDKKILLDDLDNEGKELDGIDKTITTMALAIKTEEKKLEGALAAAQKDGKFRPVTDKYNASLDKFDKKHSEVYDSILEARAAADGVRRKLAKGGTADGAIRSLNTIVEMLEFSPSQQIFVGTMDFIKTWAPQVVKANQAPTAIAPKDWDELRLREQEFRQEMKKLDTATRELARIQKQVADIIAEWQDIAAIQDLDKKAKKLFAQRVKERADLLKIGPVFEKQFTALMQKQP